MMALLAGECERKGLLGLSAPKGWEWLCDEEPKCEELDCDETAGEGDLGLLAGIPNGETLAKASNPERFWPGLEGTGDASAEVEEDEFASVAKGLEA